ncbi:hypothetical protein ACFO0N_02795 [Halobium salinum]|uniref:DUF7308 domain-containing protein n=1 Tax=Halobium salinum TaxID=1364940 RepID=A0ABD5P878_9EURY|nr:hypothetical protein [Halobium salinum]
MRRTGPRVPPLYRFVRDRSGGAESIGVVLLLVVTVAGTTAVVTLGDEALSGVERSADVQRAEHAMTLLDSRGAMAALGDTNAQQVDFGRAGAGSYGVDGSAGRITIEHVNYTAADPNDASDPELTETLYDAPLGAIFYENGDDRIAYQGGGVWRVRDEGATMVSPPEFHYRRSTLTLPVIRVTGSGTASGHVGATFERTASRERVYPNPGATADDPSGVGAPYDPDGTDGTGDEVPYDNPVRNGTIRVTVQSEFYQGWADYFRTRTDGDVTVDDAAEEAVVELQTVGGTMGDFDLPTHGNAVNVEAMSGGHPINEFEVTLQDPANSNNYKHLYWSFSATNGAEQFEVLVYSADKQRCKNGGEFAPLTVGVHYTNGTATHEWENANVDPTSGDIRIECADIDSDGKQEPRIVFDLVGSTPMDYQDVSTPADKWQTDPSGASDAKAYWTEHDDDAATGEPRTFVKGTGSAELGELTNHYLSLMGPDFDLVVGETSPSGKRIDEEASYGTIDYDQGAGGRYITFLHVTENEVEVRVS